MAVSVTVLPHSISIARLRTMLLGGDRRTAKAKKNIVLSFGIKGVDSLVQLLLVPVTLGYLNPYEYGIWLTLNSILLWINSFDIGLGNGLRNQLAAAVAKGDYRLGRSLVSTAFAMITILMLAILAVGSVIVLNVDWYGILGTTAAKVPGLPKIVYVSFALFCVNFMVKFIGNVYLAMQMPAVNNLMVMSGHLLSLVIIYLLTVFTDGSLFRVAVAFSASPVIIYTLACPVTFLFVYRQLRPSPRLFDKSLLKGLFNVGVLFFLLQISGVVLFTMSNVIISKLFGPDQVTPYNISYRYFSLINLLLAITLAPMWSAVTDAYTKGEMDWIKAQLGKAQRLLVILGAVVVLMVAISGFVYRIWIGGSVKIPMAMTVLTATYAYIIAYSTAYSTFLNGMGKLRLQVYNIIVVAALFIPSCLLLGHIFGIYGIVIAMCLMNVSGAVLNTIQIRKVVSGTASGIWDK